MMRQKEQLENSIGLIVQTQVAVANGDLTARVPLTADNVLWSVAGALNNLIARLQRARTTEIEMEQTRSSAARLTAVIRSRKHGQPTPDYTRHGTVIDTVALEIIPPQEMPTPGPPTNPSFRARHTPPPHSTTSPPGQF